MVDRQFDLGYQRAIDTGEDNRLVRPQCEGWCKEIQIETLAVSMVGQMTGLPIGPHQISCRFGSTHESGSLRNLFTWFVESNCIGCEHHCPGSSPRFGLEIVETIQKNRTESDAREAEREDSIERLRQQLKESADRLAESAQPEAASIHRLASRLFSGDTDSDVFTALLQSCDVAPEFFDAAIVELLLLGLSHIESSHACLRLIAALTRKKKDVGATALEKVLSALSLDVSIEAVSDAIDACLVDPNQLESHHIEQLVMRLDHQRKIEAGFIKEPRDYSNSLALLQRLAAGDEDRVVSTLSTLLQHSHAHVRANACETARLLAENNPSLRKRLLPAVIAMIELPEESGFDISPDHCASKYIADALVFDWAHASKVLLDETLQRSPAVRATAYGAYEKVFRRGPDWREETIDGLDTTVTDGIIHQCLTFLCDSHESPAVRRAAAEGLKSAAAARANQVVDAVDRILGAFVMISDGGPPTPAQRIILPGREREQANAVFASQQEAITEWEQLKHEVSALLKEIGELSGKRMCDTLIASIDSAGLTEQSKFRIYAIDLLGEVASHDSELARLVLPTLTKGMMNYSSAAIRGASLQAASTAFRHCDLTIPQDICDIVVLHLRDDYKYVHKTAVGAIWMWHLPFSAQQREEAFVALINLWRYYTGQPQEVFFLDDLADSLLAAAAGNNKMRLFALRIISRKLPCGERLVDQKLCDDLLRRSEYGDSVICEVAGAILRTVTMHKRDRYHSQPDWRDHALAWLHQMPEELWCKLRDELLKSALKCIETDPYDAVAFASICSEHGSHAEERRLLEAGATAAHGHHIFHGLEFPLQQLAVSAERMGH